MILHLTDGRGSNVSIGGRERGGEGPFIARRK